MHIEKASRRQFHFQSKDYGGRAELDDQGSTGLGDMFTREKGMLLPFTTSRESLSMLWMSEKIARTCLKGCSK